jgi:Ca2+-binding RTX toxin-like protein
VPQRYFDLYPLADIVVPRFPQAAIDALPDFALQFTGGALTGAAAARGIQAYLASITFADAQLGRLLDALDAGKHWDDTAVVLWSDHGYHLGDHDRWAKFTLWEEAANAPLIVYDPDQARAGSTVDVPVSLGQLFPMLAELAGTGVPDTVTTESFAGLIDGSHGAYRAGPVLTYIYGSLSMRTQNFRTIRYEDGSLEVYDLRHDPGQIDNLALDPSKAGLVTTLLSKMRAAGMAEGIRFDDRMGILNGSGGADKLIALDDVTEAVGGAGSDHYFITRSTVVTEDPGGGIDTVVLRWDGVRDDPVYTLPGHVEHLYGGIGLRGAYLRGNDLSNRIVARKGGALLANGLDGNDRIYGSTYDDFAFGDTGNDQIFGWLGDDTLQGGAGTDRLDGSTGNDTLVGGPGDDFISTGPGSDTVVFLPGHGSDRIAATDSYRLFTPLGRDFDVRTDVLELDGFRFATRADALAAFSAGPLGAIFDAQGTQVLLYGVPVGQLTVTNIRLVNPTGRQLPQSVEPGADDLPPRPFDPGGPDLL